MNWPFSSEVNSCMTVEHVQQQSHWDKHAKQSFWIGGTREYKHKHDYHNRNLLNDIILMCLPEEQLTLKVIMSSFK